MEEYISTLSIDRLTSYEILCPGKVNTDIIGAYHWNLLISQALYPFIHSIEIALRNAIHHAATRKFETEFWFDIVVNDGKSKSILEDTKNDLHRRYGNFVPIDLYGRSDRN